MSIQRDQDRFMKETFLGFSMLDVALARNRVSLKLTTPLLVVQDPGHAYIEKTILVSRFWIDFGSIFGYSGDDLGMIWAYSGHVPGML